MIYRKLDANGDYTLGKGSDNFLKNSPETVGQAVLTTLKLFQGEWFIDLSAGVPYNTKILGFNNLLQYDFFIREAILNVKGVVDIETYSSYFNPTTRQVAIAATLNTVYGKSLVSSIV